MNLGYTICLAIGSLLAVIYIILLLAGTKRYADMLAPLDSTEFRLAELYGFGFMLMDIFKYSFTSKSEQKRRKSIVVLRGAQYAEYYLQVEFAKRWSLSFLIAIFAFLMGPLGDEIILVPLFLGIAAAVCYYIGSLPEKEITKRSEELLAQFPDVVSKLALLINSGMIMRNAWEQVAYSGEGIIYKEMQQVCINMNDGMSEPDAYREFGNACVIPEIKKFASTIIQGILKGNKELSAMLTQQSSEVWSIKMNMVKRQGDAAVSKLIFPMMIVFVGIMLMIILPIFAGMGI